MDAKIPVFVLDRNVNSEKYTQWIGGDNVVIGRAVGDFVVKTLGGAGKAKGNVVEIWGGLGTQASHDRSQRLPRGRGQGKRPQIPPQPAVGRLEAGQGLRGHVDRAAQFRGYQPRLRP